MTKSNKLELIHPNWEAPSNILACCTTRTNGTSDTPYHSFNLGDHVGDNKIHVQKNRLRLQTELSLKSTPHFLNQTHSTNVITLLGTPPTLLDADAVTSQTQHQVCLVMSADCIPILLCHREGLEVAAIHAGWRGLADGVIQAACKQLHSPRSEYIAWLGPSISQENYEVGREVKARFLDHLGFSEAAFSPLGNSGKYLADMPLIAETTLKKLGISAVYHYSGCTFAEKERFFSYRRDGQTGRMATLITILD